MNTRFFAYIGFAFALIGCGTVQTGTHGTFLPTPSNGFKGLIGWVTNGPQYKEMTDNCASYGGVKNWEQARGWEQGGGPSIFVMYQRYECRGPINSPDLKRAENPHVPTQRKYQNSSPATKSSTIDSASVKCEELGFKRGTENFGDCVLKISR